MPSFAGVVDRGLSGAEVPSQDPALNDRNRRKLAKLFEQIIAADPDPTRPTLAMLIAGALHDVGYGQRGVDPAFEIEPSPDSGGVTLHIPYSHPDGTPRAHVHHPHQHARPEPFWH